jgi:hypothetical protein
MPGYNTTDLEKMSSVTDLVDFLEKRRSKPVGDSDSFEEFEQELADLMRAVESEVKAEELARYDVDADVILVEGREYRKVVKGEPKTYLTSSGPVNVQRNLFRPKGGGKCICPLELRAGIIGGWCSPLLGRQTAFLMGHMTSKATTEVFNEFGIDGPSQSSCDRLPKILSATWEQKREAWEAALRSEETIPGETALVAVSLDGVLVPDKEAQREAKKTRDEAQKKGLDKNPTGPAGYKEVGCGTVTLYATGTEGPERLETTRYARAPEPKKKTLTEQLDAELDSILNARPDLQLVALADGAEENWRYFDGPRWRRARKIVDIGHGCEHLRDGLSAFYGKDSVLGRAEYERFRIILRDDWHGVDTVITELKRLERKLPKNAKKARRKQVRKERKYFENQKERMKYALYQFLGLPFGSGIVEAACKTLATQRLKQSGMSWGDGKQPILTIRSLQQSDRWSRGWELLSSSFRKKVYRVEEHGDLRLITPCNKAA